MLIRTWASCGRFLCYGFNDVANDHLVRRVYVLVMSRNKVVGSRTRFRKVEMMMVMVRLANPSVRHPKDSQSAMAPSLLLRRHFSSDYPILLNYPL